MSCLKSVLFPLLAIRRLCTILAKDEQGVPRSQDSFAKSYITQLTCLRLVDFAWEIVHGVLCKGGCADHFLSKVAKKILQDMKSKHQADELLQGSIHQVKSLARNKRLLRTPLPRCTSQLRPWSCRLFAWWMWSTTTQPDLSNYPIQQLIELGGRDRSVVMQLGNWTEKELVIKICYSVLPL